MRVLVQYRPEERVLVIFPFALSNFPAKGNFKKWLKVALSPIFSSLNSCINGNSGLARTATSNRASTITPSNNTIYGISSSVYDWASVDIDGGERGFNWDSRQFDWNPVVKGVCPIGFSVPTMQEFKDVSAPKFLSNQTRPVVGEVTVL
jgi:hypothetical protein